MQFITYSVTLITAGGRVITKDNVRYTDAAAIKNIKQDLSREFNVSPDALVITEVSREVVA